MAITGSYDFDGIPVPNAYGQIPVFNVRDTVRTSAILYLYSTQAFAESGGAPFTNVTVTYTYDPESSESLNAQAYTAAKQMPQFAGWTDC